MAKSWLGCVDWGLNHFTHVYMCALCLTNTSMLDLIKTSHTHIYTHPSPPFAQTYTHISTRTHM